MKKTYIILITITVLLVALFTGVSGIASAEELNYDDCDKVFLKTVRELADTTSDVANLDAEKEVIYDVELNPLGYVYDFELNGERGYAILTSTQEGLSVNEIYFDAENPYTNKDGIKIYVNQFVYAYYAEGFYTFTDSDLRLTKSEIKEIFGDAFFGGGALTYGTGDVGYTFRTVNKHSLASRFPNYTSENLYNACSPVAGGNIVAYFDRYNTSLIPNYTPGSAIGSSYLYKTENPTVSSVITQLFSDMGTNSIVPGTTEPQFLNGLETYCTRQGYNISYVSCMSKSSFNYSFTKQQLDSGKPIALFLAKYNVTEIDEETNVDKLTYLIGTVNHMMVGFGYKDITYTFTDGSSRTDNYIYVASGLSERSKGYYNIAINSTINKAYSVNIY